jgi:MFS transporter, YNFM family, putative membrane transport protein
MRPPADLVPPRGARTPAPIAEPVAVPTAEPAAVPAAALLALGLAGVCAFLNVYATQPLLPLLADGFGVAEGAAALTVSAPGIAVALGSPFVGAVADRFGRRRVIVGSLFVLAFPTLLAATSGSLPALVAWRFLQGLAVPGVYAVGVAYAATAFAGRGVGRAMAAIVTGNVLGGFLGRTVSATVAEHLGWRAGFVALGVLTIAGAAATARWLPHEGPRVDANAAALRPAAGLRALGRSLRVPPLAATLAVGFGLLFAQTATFTYVTFHLARAPFQLGPAAIGAIFAVYLAGAAVTPLAGRWIDRSGPRVVLAGAVFLGIGGSLLTLAGALPLIVLGLALTCTSVFVGQAAATTHLSRAAPAEVRSVASGLYLSAYYAGGAVGGVLPSLTWGLGGWAACVALVVAVQLGMVALAIRFWHRERGAVPPAPTSTSAEIQPA